MILHVLDFDRGDACKEINALSTGLTVTAPRGHPKVYDHETLMLQADVCLLKLPCFTHPVPLLSDKLHLRYPHLPIIWVVRLRYEEPWLWPPQKLYGESVLQNGIHFMEAVYDALELQKAR